MEPKCVLILVTVSICAHCVRFREDWPKTKQALQETQLVDIVDIELNKFSDRPDPQKYPSDLSRWVKWFPTFILVSKSSWTNAQPGKNGRLEGVIFNGYMGAMGATYVGSENCSKENFLRWVCSECPRIAGLAPTEGSVITQS